MGATLELRKDFDGKWAFTWPADLVAAGLSAGAGRHDTQRGLVAAVEAKGWTVSKDGEQWEAHRE